jgi:hypothetical protein
VEAAASSAFQPYPAPSTNRPPEIRSSVAIALAVTIGSRWAGRATPVPSLIRSVTAAAAASATNGSGVRAYSSGRVSAPVGGGVRRDTGMWVCSGR